MPEYAAWPVLEQWSSGAPTRDAVCGKLYDTGRGYPAATFDGADDTEVHGFVVELISDRAEEALQMLDHYEAEEYDRIVVRTRAGLDAYTYHWCASLAGCRQVSDGMWRLA
jgi:gamma-glutamylcyclotransferase (GGCT)/AIG2-like uncharacterized protein YtfP